MWRTPSKNAPLGSVCPKRKTSDPKAEPLEAPDPDPLLSTETMEPTDAEELVRPKRHSLCRRRGPEVHASQILSALEIGDWQKWWGETWGKLLYIGMMWDVR